MKYLGNLRLTHGVRGKRDENSEGKKRDKKNEKKVRKRGKTLRKTFRVAMRLSPRGTPSPRGRHFVLRLETKSNIKDAFKQFFKQETAIKCW